MALAKRAAPLDVDDYLIDEANLRGFWGAFRATTPDRAVDAALELEDIVVGLLAPQTPVEGRALKLVVRILQSGQLDEQKLLHRARREAALPALYWLLQLIPNEEVTPSVQMMRESLALPRGYRPVAYSYDPKRLIQRPARKGDIWRKP
jgi:hypothetical protein